MRCSTTIAEVSCLGSLAQSYWASCSPPPRPMSTCMPASASPTTSTARPSFWAPASLAFPALFGPLFLTVCLIRAMRGDFTPKQHFGFEAAAWYWHFVDVVWLFLFTCIYVWGARSHY